MPDAAEMKRRREVCDRLRNAYSKRHYITQGLPWHAPWKQWSAYCRWYYDWIRLIEDYKDGR